MLIDLPKSIERAFTCPLCQQTLPVEYTDPDAFDEPEPVPGNGKWGRDRVLEHARVALNKRASRALALIRCPQCGKRSKDAQRQGLKRSLWRVVAVAPMVVLVSLFVSAWLWPKGLLGGLLSPLGMSLITLGVTSPGVIWLSRRRLMAAADRSVRLLSGTTSS